MILWNKSVLNKVFTRGRPFAGSVSPNKYTGVSEVIKFRAYIHSFVQNSYQLLLRTTSQPNPISQNFTNWYSITLISWHSWFVATRGHIHIGLFHIMNWCIDFLCTAYHSDSTITNWFLSLLNIYQIKTLFMLFIVSRIKGFGNILERNCEWWKCILTKSSLCACSGLRMGFICVTS